MVLALSVWVLCQRVLAYQDQNSKDKVLQTMASMSSAQIVSVSAMQNRANHPQAAAAAAAAEYGSQVMTTRATSRRRSRLLTLLPAGLQLQPCFSRLTSVCVCCVFVFADLAFTHVCCCG